MARPFDDVAQAFMMGFPTSSAMHLLEVPIVPRKWGIICLVFNIFPPGIGTMVAAGNQESVKHFVFGLLQFLFFWTLVGWIWSIWWGINIFRHSTRA